MSFSKKNNLKKILRSISSDNSGVVAVIVGICIFALMIAAALAVDVGSLFEDRRHLQTVADSAALAGAQELPENPEEAIAKATEYANENYSEDFNINVVIEPYFGIANASITVTVINPDSPLYFARVMDQESTGVVAGATAIVASPEEVNDIVPWGIPYDLYEFGDEVVLKYGAGPSGHSYSGNFQALGIDQPGGNEYKDNIIEGAETLLKIGDWVYTQTGNLVGPSIQGTETRIYDLPDANGGMNSFGDLTQEYAGGNELAVPDSQFIIVPLINELIDAHGHTEVQILGFACMIITEIQDMQDDPEFGNGVVIVGRFVNNALINSDGSVVAAGTNDLKVVRLIN